MVQKAGMFDRQTGADVVPCRFLYGGTFDPVHRGHVHVVDYLSQLVPEAVVHVVIACRPVDKRCTDFKTRLAMLQLALQDKNVEIDLIEASFKGPSVTETTLKKLRLCYPETPLIWVMGDDCLSALSQWKNWQALIQWAHLYVVYRHGNMPSGECLTWLQTHQTQQWQQCLQKQHGLIYRDNQLVQVACSSTQIRKALAQGLDCSTCLDARVLKYVVDEKLYL